jgi:LPXTG-motif cell wall-anchored protein
MWRALCISGSPVNTIALSLVGMSLLLAALWVQRRARKSRLDRKESVDD